VGLAPEVGPVGGGQELDRKIHAGNVAGVLILVNMDIHRYTAPDMKRTDPDVVLLSALADPVRLSFVRQLVENDGVCACDFSECCTVSQPTISHHLKVLRDAGVVVSERQGTNIVYSLAPDFSRRWSGIGASLAGLVQVAS
jgi:ArsR family transcriptional regulator